MINGWLNCKKSPVYWELIEMIEWFLMPTIRTLILWTNKKQRAWELFWCIFSDWKSQTEILSEEPIRVDSLSITQKNGAIRIKFIGIKSHFFNGQHSLPCPPISLINPPMNSTARNQTTIANQPGFFPDDPWSSHFFLIQASKQSLLIIIVQLKQIS